MYFQHGGVDLGRGAGEAHAPARHGERLAEPAEEHGALLHPGERGDRRVPAAVGELGVNFVGDDEKIVLFDERDDGFELLLRHDAARGVVGIGEDDRLGAGGDRLFERFGREDEAVLRAAADGHGRAAAQLHDGRVRDVGRVGDQDLIADVAHRAEGKIDALARPHRDDDVLGGIFHRKALFQVPRDEGAQLLKPAVARVLREAALQRADARRTHLPRGDEVGLADAEGDGVGHMLDDVEIFADAAGLQRLGAGIEKVPHGWMESLPRGCFFVMAPSILYFLRMKCVAVEMTQSKVEMHSEIKRETPLMDLDSTMTRKS